MGLIPARGGSKGVPGKNSKPLAGKPLIVYTIESALAATSLAEVVVNTDDASIAQIAHEAGAYIPFQRPEELAQDHTPTLPVIQHTLRWLQDAGKIYDAVCLLQPTNPFRPKGFIDEAVRCFVQSGADSLISVLPVPHEFNPHWVFEPQADGRLRIATGEHTIIPRRQELPPAFFRDGSIYLTRSDILLEKNSLFGNTIAYIEAVTEYHVNIDTLDDWAAAERLVTKLKGIKPICK